MVFVRDYVTSLMIFSPEFVFAAGVWRGHVFGSPVGVPFSGAADGVSSVVSDVVVVGFVESGVHFHAVRYVRGILVQWW